MESEAGTEISSVQTISRSYIARHDGNVTHDTDPRVMALLQRISRCGYLIDQHRQGIAINSRCIAELRAGLERIEVRP